MKVGFVKNSIITFFVLLAIYQTAKLWFEDFSSHNFFYELFSVENSVEIDEGAFFTLESIFVNRNDEKIKKFSSDIYTSEFKPVFDKAINLVAEKGCFIFSGKLDWDSVLSSKSVIYQYSTHIVPHDIAMMFGFKKSIMDPVSVDIDTVCIIPSASVPEYIDVIFANSETNTAYTFRLENNNYIYDLSDTISGMNESKDGELYYISTAKNGFDIFDKNIFIPNWSGAGFGYNTVEMVNPFEEEGSVLMNRLEKNIDIFFDNPAAKWTSQVNNVYTYSDENTVLKYYTTGVLEYSGYNTVTDSSQGSFYDDYKQAIAFIAKDTNIKNEYYLKKYEKDSEKTVLYFDYKIGNFPIMLSEDIKKNIEMSSVIEVTVANGRVSKYKRFVYNFSLNRSYQTFVVENFLEVIDSVLAKNQSEQLGLATYTEIIQKDNDFEILSKEETETETETENAVSDILDFEQNFNSKITDMYLAYEVDYSDESIFLKWFVEQ